jgi:hypothetical protein
MDRPSRVRHRQRIGARSRPKDDSGVTPNPQSGQPCDWPIQIDVTFILPRRLAWLVAGIAIGNLRLPDGLLEKASLIVRALLSG